MNNFMRPPEINGLPTPTLPPPPPQQLNIVGREQLNPNIQPIPQQQQQQQPPTLLEAAKENGMGFMNNIKDKLDNVKNNVIENVNDNTTSLSETATSVNENMNHQLENLKQFDLEKVKENIPQIMEKVTNVRRMVCSPAIVYVSIALTALGFGFLQEMPKTMFLFRLFSILLWTFCINFICHNNLTSIAWIIVLVPYSILILQMLEVIYVPKMFFNIILSPTEQTFFGI